MLVKEKIAVPKNILRSSHFFEHWFCRLLIYKNCIVQKRL